MTIYCEPSPPPPRIPTISIEWKGTHYLFPVKLEITPTLNQYEKSTVVFPPCFLLMGLFVNLSLRKLFVLGKQMAETVKSLNLSC